MSDEPKESVEVQAEESPVAAAPFKSMALEGDDGEMVEYLLVPSEGFGGVLEEGEVAVNAEALDELESAVAGVAEAGGKLR